jgi:hypothetical protein
MAYINFVVFCLCWHALFTESMVNCVVVSFHYLMLLLFELRFTFLADSLFCLFRKSFFSWNSEWLKRKIATRACSSLWSSFLCSLASSFHTSIHPLIICSYLFT